MVMLFLLFLLVMLLLCFWVNVIVRDTIRVMVSVCVINSAGVIASASVSVSALASAGVPVFVNVSTLSARAARSHLPSAIMFVSRQVIQ